MEVLRYGHILLWLAAAVTAAIAVLSLLGIGLRDRRFVLAARSGFYCLFLLLTAVSACLIHGFVTGAYNNEYVFNYSERDLVPFFKMAGLWAGLDGSLIFWTTVLALMSAIAAFQHRWSSRHPSGRRMEPYTYLALAAILGFFIALSISQTAFAEMSLDERLLYARHFGVDIDQDGNLADGKGLNPQLVNYWFVIHPPCLYLGLVTFSVPFAFAIGALMSGELGSYWIRIARRWAMVSWLFLTSGVFLGGLWAYRQLGWGGYWAWDPVENASFLPWCAATAFLHSVMVQERRDMLKGWNVFLILFTFFLTIEATYMTRSGEVTSVHTFALNESVGDWFRYFKFAIAGVGLFLLFYRFRELRPTNRLESVFCRETVFFANNLVLVAIALVVWFLSWLPTNSVAYLGKEWVADAPYFNKVMPVLFVLLLLFTAVGPGLGWVKSSLRCLWNFFWPFVAASGFVVAVYVWFLASGKITAVRDVFPKFMADALWGRETAGPYNGVGVYPTGVFLFLAAFIVCTVAGEFLRTVRGRMRVRKESLVLAAFTVFTRDNRRYGGYAVHIGIAVLTVGILGSSLFQTHEQLQLKIGESGDLGPYRVTPVEATRSFQELDAAERGLRDGTLTMSDVEPGLPYLLDQVRFRVTRRVGGAVAHGDSGNRNEGVEREVLVCELRPERRFYPKQDNTWISEPSIRRGIVEDIYLYYRMRDQQDRVYIEAFINPLMILIWAAWAIMLLGAMYALLPLSRNRVGLAE
ncbi:MAG: cytochrome c biogenesis protein CcsA [Planctomycetota bacterium]|nr:cytochrome c biogenesis protein CcsA [Planctomycetota bacterium]